MLYLHGCQGFVLFLLANGEGLEEKVASDWQLVQLAIGSSTHFGDAPKGHRS